MAEYEDDEIAEDSNNEKELFKAEAHAGRKRRLAKNQTVKKSFNKPGAGWWQRMSASIPVISKCIGDKWYYSVGTSSGTSRPYRTPSWWVLQLRSSAVHVQNVLNPKW